MKINANRRSFLKGACVGAGVVLSSSFLEAKSEEKATRDFLLTFKHNMSFETANEIGIWQPLAMLHSFQTPYNLKVVGNHSDYSISNDSYVPMLHAAWRNDSANKELNVSFSVKTHYTKGSIDMPFKMTNTDANTDDRYIRTDGAIANIASSISGSSELERAKALFAWVAKNVKNGENASGIRDIISHDGTSIMRGEDISASSVFVALCRASGIEALEAFGLRLDSGRHGIGDNKQELYSRSVIKVDGEWIPNDVILATKALQDSNGARRDILESAFSEWDNNWVLFNFARDVRVGRDNSLISTMQNVYGEIDGTKLSSYAITHFNSVVG